MDDRDDGEIGTESSVIFEPGAIVSFNRHLSTTRCAMQQPSRRELREKLLEQHRRHWNVSPSDDDEPVRIVDDTPNDATFWDENRRPNPLGWIPVVLVLTGGIAAAFAVGIGVGYLWTLR
jgi:hypothetical protein